MPFLAISVPTVTTTLQKTTDSDQSRQNREKCQRIIDYVFGNGPFPYSDITAINEVHKEYLAQLIAQQKLVTDGKQPTENQEDETVRLKTVVTSEDQPDIVSIRKDREPHSSENKAKSQDNDEEAHLSVVDYQETKSNKEDIITPPSYSKDQSPNTNKIQELDSDQENKSSTMNTRKPLKLIRIKPLIMSNHKNIDIKCYGKINTTDDEFFYENSSGEEIYKEPIRRTNKITNKEITSNTAVCRESTQDNTKAVPDEKEVKAISTIKGNEEKENSQRKSIKEFACKNTENALRITENENKFQEVTTDHRSGDNLVITTTGKQHNEHLTPLMEKSVNLRLFDIPFVQPKVPSNNETTKKEVKCPTETKPKSNEDVKKLDEFQSNRSSIRDGGIIQIELYMPTKQFEESWGLYKAQNNKINNSINAKININDKENVNTLSLPFPLISSKKPASPDNHRRYAPQKTMPNGNCKHENAICFKERTINAGKKVLIDCNKTTQKTFSESIPNLSMEALEKGKKNVEDTMNYKKEIKYIQDQKAQHTDDSGNPFKNAVCEPNSFHFDYFANYGQNQLSVKAADKNIPKNGTKNQSVLEESEEDLLTGHAVTLPCGDQLLQKEKIDMPRRTFLEQQKNEFYTSQQCPQQHPWCISQRQPVEMFSPKNFFIQNRPAIPAPNEHVWKAPNKRKSPASHKHKKKLELKKLDTPQKLLGQSHAQGLKQQRNPVPTKEQPLTIERGPSPAIWPGDCSQVIQIHRHKPEKKPDIFLRPIIQHESDHKPEPKPQKSMSTKENSPLELENRHEEKHDRNCLNIEKEEDIITQVKKQRSQWYTSENIDDTKTTLESETQKKKKDQSTMQQLDPPNESEMLQGICSSTKWPVLEFRVTDDMPLSQVMKVIRLRNQFLFIKEFLESVEMSKCGDKKPDCPPQAPVCPQQPPCPPVQPPCPPVQQSPPTPPPPPPPCTPAPKEPKPPPKCKCKPKLHYVAVKDMFGVLPRRVSAHCIDIPTIEFQPFELQEPEEPEHVWIDTGCSVFVAGSFDPWVPIPNYPYPKKDIKIPFECDPRCKPKKFPIYVKPKEKPCTGFPKRLSCSRKRLKNFVVPCNLN